VKNISKKLVQNAVGIVPGFGEVPGSGFFGIEH
jgi:hypothetical protein